MFVSIKSNLSEKLEQLDTSIRNLETNAKQYASGLDQDNGFLAAFRKYGTMTELTRPMLLELLKEIRVYDENRIEIELNFRDEYARLMEYLEMNRDATESA